MSRRTPRRPVSRPRRLARLAVNGSGQVTIPIALGSRWEQLSRVPRGSRPLAIVVLGFSLVNRLTGQLKSDPRGNSSSECAGSSFPNSCICRRVPPSCQCPRMRGSETQTYGGTLAAYGPGREAGAVVGAQAAGWLVAGDRSTASSLVQIPSPIRPQVLRLPETSAELVASPAMLPPGVLRVLHAQLVC